jgi:serine/threonine protein kinase
MERYTRLRSIGEGSYGQALLVKCKESGEKFVIKSVDLVRSPTQP